MLNNLLVKDLKIKEERNSRKEAEDLNKQWMRNMEVKLDNSQV